MNRIFLASAIATIVIVLGGVNDPALGFLIGVASMLGVIVFFQPRE